MSPLPIHRRLRSLIPLLLLAVLTVAPEWGSGAPGQPPHESAAQQQEAGQTAAKAEPAESPPNEAALPSDPGQLSEADVGQQVRDMLPAALKDRTILMLEPWQWLGLVLLVLAGIIADRILVQIVRPIASRMLARVNRELGPEIVRRTARPFALILAALLIRSLLGILMLPDSADARAGAILVFCTTLAVIWAGLRLADLAGELLTIRAAHTSSKTDDLLVPLARKSIKVLIIALGTLYVLSALNIDYLPVLTGLGLGGLAIAFAAQNTVENFFGSLAVILDRPFDVGDWVRIDAVEGKVEELGFRSTRLRTSAASEMTIPNATLVKAIVDNLGRRQFRPWRTMIGLTYKTPPERIESFCEEVRKLIALSPHTHKEDYFVNLNQFAPSSLDVLVQVQLTVPDQATEFLARQEIMMGIIRAAQRLNVEFAYPTQTIHMAERSS